SGHGLSLVVGALAAWGRTHRPHPDGISPRFVAERTGVEAEPAFVTPDGELVSPSELSTGSTPDLRSVSGRKFSPPPPRWTGQPGAGGAAGPAPAAHRGRTRGLQ